MESNEKPEQDFVPAHYLTFTQGETQSIVNPSLVREDENEIVYVSQSGVQTYVNKRNLLYRQVMMVRPRVKKEKTSDSEGTD